MDIVSLEYYRDTFKGTDTNEEELRRTLDKAQDMVEMETIFDISLYSEVEELKKAICSQAEYIINNGGISEVCYNDDIIKSVSTEGFSYSIEKNKNKYGKLCEIACKYMRLAGLMGKSIDVNSMWR